MNATTSTAFHPGALISHRPYKGGRNHGSTALAKKIRETATGFVHLIDRIAAGGSEEFYQNHVNAIFMAIYTEVAFGPLLGALAIYLYSR